MSAAMETIKGQAAAERDPETRRRIVETAERLYREIGFQKTTVADIARELKMSSANVYRYFASKAEINGAVAQHLLGEVVAAITAIVEGPGGAGERLRKVINTNQALNAERFIAERKLHEMVQVALDDDWPIVDEYVSTMRMLMGRLVAEGVASGEFAPISPEQGAALVQAACIVYCHPRLMVECTDKPVPSSDEMIDFCLRALRA
jgi:AcrR family transcriptional regulator